jgi:hypothetical protein
LRATHRYENSLSRHFLDDVHGKILDRWSNGEYFVEILDHSPYSAGPALAQGNSLMRSRILVLFTISACSVEGLLFSCTSHAATVAYWQFEPGNLEADSVGGHVLSNTGVTSSADKSPLAPGTGSALFSGTQTAFSTTQTLDLSSYTDLTVEYLIKTGHTALAIVFEHFGANTNEPGVFGSAINDIGLSLEGYQRGTTGTYISATSADVTDGNWHHVAVTIDGSETGADRIKLFVDGVDIGEFQPGFTPAGTPPFLNQTFYIGSRGNTGFKFAGSLDELRISDAVLSPSEFLIPIIPEPGSLLLAAIGFAASLFRRNRNNHGSHG